MDKAQRDTDRALHNLIRKLNRIYRDAQVEIREATSPLWDDLLLADESATQRKRLNYAKSDGALDELVEIVAAIILAANKKAVSAIDATVLRAYGENYGHIQDWSLRYFDVVIPDRAVALANLQNRFDRRAIRRLQDHKYISRQAARAVTVGVRRGESIPNITKRVLGVENRSKASATNVARTETTRIASRGRFDAMVELEKQGAIIEKEWLVTHDGRERDSHRSIGGERVGLHDRFSNGLMFPGDPSAPAEEVCNCRCSLAYHIVGWRDER